MRFSDAMKPALNWSEAAMLPALPRTFSGGAALKQLPQVEKMDTTSIAAQMQNAPAQADAQIERMRALRRAAYHSVRQLGH